MEINIGLYELVGHRRSKEFAMFAYEGLCKEFPQINPKTRLCPIHTHEITLALPQEFLWSDGTRVRFQNWYPPIARMLWWIGKKAKIQKLQKIYYVPSMPALPTETLQLKRYGCTDGYYRLEISLAYHLVSDTLYYYQHV